MVARRRAVWWDRGSIDPLDVLHDEAGFLLTYPQQRDDAGLVSLADNIAVPGEGILASSAYPGAEELDESGSGTMDKDNWTASTATLSNPSPKVLRVTATGGNAFASQAMGAALIGVRVAITGINRGDGTNNGAIFYGSDVYSGTSATSNQEISVEGTSSSGIIQLKSLSTIGSYVDYEEVSVKPANPLNGGDTGGIVAGVPMGVALGKEYDALTAITTLDHNTLNSIMNFEMGAINSPFEMDSAGTWADATARYLIYIYADANNQMWIRKSVTNDSLDFFLKAGGTEYAGTYDVSALPDVNIPYITWDGSRVQFIINSTVLETFGPIGAWVGNLTAASLGAAPGPVSVHDGKMQYPSFFTAAIDDAARQKINQSLGVNR